MITNGILPQTPGADSFRRVLGCARNKDHICHTNHETFNNADGSRQS